MKWLKKVKKTTPVLFLYLILLSSCANISFINFDYDKVSLGSNIEEVKAQTGNPKYHIKLGSKDVMIFNTGVVVLTSNQVTFRGSFHKKRWEILSVMENVMPGEKLEDAFLKLYAPDSISQNGNMLMLEYSNGSVVFNDEQVLGTYENFYKESLQFNMGINAFTDPKYNHQGKYLIISGNEKVPDHDLQFKEVKTHVQYILENAGLEVTENREKANFILIVNYGISEPKEDLHIVSTPVYNFNYIPGQNVGVYNRFGSQIGSLQTQGQFYSSYAGQRVSTYTTVNYNRWLNLESVDYAKYKSTKKIVNNWKIVTNSIGPSSDLRTILPPLMSFSGSYIGKDTQMQVQGSLSSHDVNRFLNYSKVSSDIKTKPRGLAGRK